MNNRNAPTSPVPGLSNAERAQALVGGLITFGANAQQTPTLGRLAAELSSGQAEVPDGVPPDVWLRTTLSARSNGHDFLFPNAFSGVIATPLGSATVLLGDVADSLRDAELTIEAALLSRDTKTVRDVAALTSAVLPLMRAVSERAVLSENETVDLRVNEPVHCPPEAEIPVLWLGPEELSTLVGHDWESELSRLVAPKSEVFDRHPDPLMQRPLVAAGVGGVIVARPDCLILALRHAVLRIVAEGGEADLLAHEVFEICRARFNDGLARFGLAMDVDVSLESESLVGFADRDVIVHGFLLTPDYSNSPEDLFDPWDAFLVSDVDGVLARAESRIRAEVSGVRSIIHVVVHDGTGPMPAPQFSNGDRIRNPRLSFTGSEFEVLSQLPDQTGQDLIKFARAVAELYEDPNVRSLSALDLFETWRSAEFTFEPFRHWIASQGAGHAVITARPGEAHTIRSTVIERYEPRAVLSPAHDGWWRIARLLEYRDVDIWRPWGDPNWPPHMFVPEIGPGVWVLDALSDTQHAPSGRLPARETRRKWTELVAFWLWRLRDNLLPLREAASAAERPLVVSVVVRLEEGPVSRAMELDKELFDVRVSQVGWGSIELEVGSEALETFGRHDNDAERQLVDRVVENLATSIGGVQPSVRALMPAGVRKLSYQLAADPAMREPGAPLVFSHEADSHWAMRLAGHRVAMALNLEAGVIPQGATEAAFREAVEALWASLETLLNEFQGPELLRWLVALNEAALHRRALAESEHGLVASVFGWDEERALRRAHDQGRLAAVSVPLRFLIEITGARLERSSGTKRFSFEAYGQVLALGEAIVRLGTLSDVRRSRLGDPRLSLLPNLQLEVEASPFGAAQQAYSAGVATGDVERSLALHASRLSEDAATPPDAPDASDDLLDLGFADEYGCSFSQLLDVVDELIQLPEHPLGFTEIGADALRAIAIARTGDVQIALAALDTLTLPQRKDHLRPARPYYPNDVYPWRNNRRLSYLRRPLLSAENDADGTTGTYVFGRGAAYAAIEFLERVLSNGRMQAQSKLLRDAVSRRQGELSRAFELEVASVLEEAGPWLVRTRVRKLGSRLIARSSGQDLGDVDVMAVDPSARVILCIDAKRLAVALAPHQLRNELDDTFLQGGEKSSAAERLVERAAVVRERLDAALELFGIESGTPGDWDVFPCIVTSREIFSVYLGDCPVPVMDLRGLAYLAEARTLSRKLAAEAAARHASPRRS